MSKSKDLGTRSIPQLLASQSIPAAIGFMVMTLNMVVDTIFVGQYIGKLAIGAISVVMPISFLMSSVGMAIGIGGSSIVSRAFGAKDQEKAQLTFNNQISLTLILITIILAGGYIFYEPIITLFGAQGDLFSFSESYYLITLLGIPFLSLAMMANNNLRAEGKPRVAMLILIIPSVVNMFMDWVLIVLFDMGIEGAAWATTLSNVAAGSFMIFYYLSGKTELRVTPSLFRLKKNIVNEITRLGLVSLMRQGSISLLTIVLNHSLFYYGNQAGIGGETAISIYAIPNRIAMFAFFPLIGLSQGFIPIAGFNYGAQSYKRVKEVVRLAIVWGLIIAGFLTLLLLLGSNFIPTIFANEQEVDLLHYAPQAIFVIFFATPVVIFQLIGSSYYQAIGKAMPALFLALTKQFFFLTPFVLIFPLFAGFEGIWYAFPAADITSALICYYFLRIGMKKLDTKQINTETSLAN